MAAIGDWLLRLLGRAPRLEEGPARKRGKATHIVILDGTMSSLDEGFETNAGLTFKLLRESGHTANLTLHYEAGIQWRDWRSTLDVLTGKGLNRQIQRAYGVLASRWRPGDRIILIGYSRGAFAVRSLAGVIDVVGLLRHDQATVRNIRQAYRHYRTGGRSKYAQAFTENFCHASADVEAVACWDTVKALGMRLPILWRWAEATHQFHNHRLGAHVRNGFHALALDETREAYAPILWETPANWSGHLEQVWFRGSHADIGGQVGKYPKARPLANIPLVWMLEKLESCDLPLPLNWQSRFACDPMAPSIGTWHGWAKLFLSRRRRQTGTDLSETLHESVRGHPSARKFKQNVAIGNAEDGSARLGDQAG